MNAVFETGLREFGPDFRDRLNRTVEKMRGSPLRVVENCFIQPSQDIGELAGKSLPARGRDRDLTDRVAGAAMRAAARGAFTDKDLLSYLLFDSSYTQRLLELGREDAAGAHDELLALFRGTERVPELAAGA